MKRLPSILILLLAATFCAAGCHREDENPEQVPSNAVDYTTAEPGEVAELQTEEAYRDFIAKNEFVVVKFGAEWCPPCNLLDPEFDKIAGYFQKSGVKFARVDCEVLSNVANQLKINSIPDTRVFYGGKEYTSIKGNNPYGIANVVESMRQEVGAPAETAKQALFDDRENEEDSVVFDENLPSEPDEPVEPDVEDDFVIEAEPAEVTRIVTTEDLEKFLAENDLAVIKFGATWCPPCRRLEPKLPLLAGYFKDKGLAFADVDVDDSKEVAQRYEVSAIPDVIVFHKGERKNHVLGYLPDEIMSMLENFAANPEGEEVANPEGEEVANSEDEEASSPEGEEAQAEPQTEPATNADAPEETELELELEETQE